MGSRLAVQVLANLVIGLVVVVLGAGAHHLSLSVDQYGLVLLVSILGGTVFLCIGQVLVALVKSSETVNSTARLVYIGLLLLGLLGQGGSLGHT
jgi:ABC-type transport system involved in multi-copper enzyme maturation permease subunit